MSKIDEIRERLLNYKNNHVDTGVSMDAEHEFETNAKPDIEYLLSKLEAAEKALDWYEKIPHYDRRLSGGTSAMEADAGRRAREALQQLRS